MFLFTLQYVGGDGGEGAATDTDKPVESTPAVWPSASTVFKLNSWLNILAFLIIYLESEVKFPEQPLRSKQPKDQ